MSGAEPGLSGAEAARRLAEYGPNEPASIRFAEKLRSAFSGTEETE